MGHGMLGRNWEPGTATIVARKNLNIDPRGIFYAWEYELDVQPAGGAPPFRVTTPTVASNRRGFVDADVGAVVPVFCNVKRQSVKFDTTS
jgi:hypothetical protein